MPPTVYTASYRQPQNHHGQTIAISRGIPRGFTPHQRCQWLAPSRELLDNWKRWTKGGVTDSAIAHYTEDYREEWRVQGTMQRLREWLPTQDWPLTLLCWEKAGEFCHRNLVYKAIAATWPEWAGGQDVPAPTFAGDSSNYSGPGVGDEAVWSDGERSWPVLVYAERATYKDERWFVVACLDDGHSFEAYPHQLSHPVRAEVRVAA